MQEGFDPGLRAQVVRDDPNTFLIVPVGISNWSGARWSGFDLEVVDDTGRVVPRQALEVSLIHASRAFLGGSRGEVHPFRVDGERYGAHGRRARPERTSSSIAEAGSRSPRTVGAPAPR